jgi:hypothetical protein
VREYIPCGNYVITSQPWISLGIRVTATGSQPIRINQVGDLLGYGTVYHHPDEAANILSFHKITKIFKSVIYDNKKKDAFVVTKDDVSEMEFIPLKDGLYHYDFAQSIKRRKKLENLKIERTMMINTIEVIKRNFTKREIEDANQARRLFNIMGRPSVIIFENIIRKGKFVNNTVTMQDYKNALQIYGPELGVLKGKTTRKRSDHFQVQILDNTTQEHYSEC